MTTNDQSGPGTATAERTPVATFDSTGTIRIGRDEDNDIVLPDFWVSRKHAEIRKVGAEHHIIDLNSSNGLHHNGRRVPRGVLAAGDRFTIGRHEFLFDGVHIYQHDDQGPTSIIADDITVEVGKSVLLDDVSFALRHGTLLGIVGPSGCGKSTLLKAMTGIRPASRGKLLYDGKDLYKHYSELRYRIGMVPQDDVLHRQLTVRRALRFAASLRFASDVPRKQRKERVNEVLDLLGLTARAKQRIDTLSGGQRKRTSVALELLTEPSLLALDEPTSGLDPALDKEVMRELRLLADRGRTVVVVTHSVLHLDLCDHVLVMCLGGRMGYFGPPDELLAFFGSEDYADVFDKVTNDPDRWAQKYRNSDIYRKYVGEVALQLLASETVEPSLAVPTPRAPVETVGSAPAPAEATPPVAQPVEATGEAPAGPAEAATATPVATATATPVAPADGATPATAPAAPARQVFADAAPARKATASGVQDLSMSHRALHPVAPLRQFLTLSLRMLAVILSDRGYATFLVGLPLALALLSYTVPGDKGLSPDPAGFGLEGQRLLVVFVIGAAFMGVAVAIREIINESSIYRRERAIGLSPTAYLASKLLVFIIIDAIQVTLFVYLAMLDRKPPTEALVLSNPVAEIIIAVTLVAIASTVLGLLASALVKTTEQTTPILVVSVMAQLVLSGGLFVFTDQKVLEIIAWLDPSRWGFASAAATTNLIGFPFPDPIWAHEPVNFWRGVGIMLVQIVVLVGLTRLALRRYEPGRG
ncbi:MAG TPA: ATP-binding cassette domain-containing protein [Micromonosporaceae bacterium]